MRPAPLRLYYGGTFDPIHNGHLAIACRARDHFGVPVRLVPSADPPHRAAPGASAAQRLAMVELAIGGRPGLVVDEGEIQRALRWPGRPSYTVDTLEALRKERGPDVPLAWLVGGDSLASLTRWRRWQDLFALGHIVVVDREGSGSQESLSEAIAAVVRGNGWTPDPQVLSKCPAGCLYRLPMPLRPESSTAVRSAVAAGMAIDHLVPATVAAYVAGHQLYGVDGA